MNVFYKIVVVIFFSVLHSILFSVDEFILDRLELRNIECSEIMLPTSLECMELSDESVDALDKYLRIRNKEYSDIYSYMVQEYDTNMVMIIHILKKHGGNSMLIEKFMRFEEVKRIACLYWMTCLLEIFQEDFFNSAFKYIVKLNKKNMEFKKWVDEFFEKNIKNGKSRIFFVNNTFKISKNIHKISLRSLSSRVDNIALLAEFISENFKFLVDRVENDNRINLDDIYAYVLSLRSKYKIDSDVIVEDYTELCIMSKRVIAILLALHYEISFLNQGIPVDSKEILVRELEFKTKEMFDFVRSSDEINYIYLITRSSVA